MSIVAEKYPDDRQRSRAMGIAMGGAATGVLGNVIYSGTGGIMMARRLSSNVEVK